MSKEITVISPFFNRAASVPRSIESLANQTFDNFKAVIVDDGSKDDTYAVASRYVSDKIEVVTQNNRGYTPTMISLCNAVTSEFIAIHGAGDESLPHRLAFQYAFLKQNPDVVAVGCGIENIDEVTGQRWNVVPPHRIRKGPINGRFGISHGEVMFRTDAYRKAGGYRAYFKVGQASDLFRRMSRLGDFGYVEDVLYRRYLTADGISANLNSLLMRDVLSAISTDVFDRSLSTDIPPGDTPLKDDLDRWGFMYPYFSGASRILAANLATASVKSWYGENRPQAMRLARIGLAERITPKGLAALLISVAGVGPGRRLLLPLVKKLSRGGDENNLERFG